MPYLTRKTRIYRKDKGNDKYNYRLIYLHRETVQEKDYKGFQTKQGDHRRHALRKKYSIKKARKRGRRYLKENIDHVSLNPNRLINSCDWY